MYDVSSSATPGMSEWVDADSGLNSTFSLQNCTDFSMLHVGVVKECGDCGEWADEGYQSLTRIFDRLNAAYVANNAGKTLIMEPFDDEESLNGYVRNRDYANKALCFAIGWNTFRPGAMSPAFDINLRWNPSFGP